MGLLTGPHHTSFSEPGSFTMRLSRGERPVLAPEYAVSAPVEVMADPVSYTRASSYRAATEGLPICIGVSGLAEGGTLGGPDATHNGHAVVVDVCSLMELFFKICVLSLRPKGESHVRLLSMYTRHLRNGEEGADACQGTDGLLHTVRVKAGLIDAHDGEGGGMVIVLLLFGDQLGSVVTGKRSGRFRSIKERGFRRFWSRHGGCFCMSSMCSALGISKTPSPPPA